MVRKNMLYPSNASKMSKCMCNICISRRINYWVSTEWRTEFIFMFWQTRCGRWVLWKCQNFKVFASMYFRVSLLSSFQWIYVCILHSVLPLDLVTYFYAKYSYDFHFYETSNFRFTNFIMKMKVENKNSLR